MLNSARTRTVVRMVAGGYVGYLGIKLLSTKENWENHATMAIIFGIFFVLAASVIIFLGLRSLLKGGRVILTEEETENIEEIEEVVAGEAEDIEITGENIAVENLKDMKEIGASSEEKDTENADEIPAFSEKTANENGEEAKVSEEKNN